MPLLLNHVAFAITCLLVVAPVQAAQVWPGFNFTFVKPSMAPLPPPADLITPSVALTRGLSRGLYNAVVEQGYNGSGPTDTEWATGLNNPSQTIAATNWQALEFTSWVSAYGGGNVLRFEIEGRPAVVHLITDDIYLDLRFSDWEGGTSNGGGFTYTRAVGPLPGDYNANGTVDAADFTVWRDILGATVATPGAGADGNGDGRIEAGDYQFWKQRFGVVAGGAAEVAGAVPEPESLLLFALMAVILPAIPRGCAPRSLGSKISQSH